MAAEAAAKGPFMTVVNNTVLLPVHRPRATAIALVGLSGAFPAVALGVAEGGIGLAETGAEMVMDNIG